MAKEFAKKLYSSKTWQDTREAYAKSKGYLCENCLRHGLITTGEIVHHKEHLTPDNINNPEVTLNFDNLELLCRKCHGAHHSGRRYSIDASGRVTPLYD